MHSCWMKVNLFKKKIVLELICPQNCAAHRLFLRTHRCCSVFGGEQSEAKLMWQSESLRLDEGTLGLFLWNYVNRMNINKCWQLCICVHARVFWLVGGSVWARPLCVFAPGTWGWPQSGGHQWKHGTAPGRPHPLPTCGTAAPGALSQHQCTEQGETSALNSSINHPQRCTFT